MRFKVKVITPTGSESIESNNAQDENKLRELYEMMGYTLVEVLEKEEEKTMFDELDPATMAQINNMKGGVPNMGNIGIPAPEPKSSKSTYKEYTDNGVNYRVELDSGKLQKQDWVKLDSDELKDISIEDGNKMVSAYSKKLKLFRLKWIDLG